MPEETEHVHLVSGGVAGNYGVKYNFFNASSFILKIYVFWSFTFLYFFQHKNMFFFFKLLALIPLLLFCHLHAAAWEAQSRSIENAFLPTPRTFISKGGSSLHFYLIFAWLSPLSLCSKVTLVGHFLTNRLRTAVSIANSYPCRFLCYILLYHTYVFLTYLLIYLLILMFIFLQPQYELHKQKTFDLFCFLLYPWA